MQIWNFRYANVDFFKTPHIQIWFLGKDPVFKFEFLVLFSHPCCYSLSWHITNYAMFHDFSFSICQLSLAGPMDYSIECLKDFTTLLNPKDLKAGFSIQDVIQMALREGFWTFSMFHFLTIWLKIGTRHFCHHAAISNQPDRWAVCHSCKFENPNRKVTQDSHFQKVGHNSHFRKVDKDSHFGISSLQMSLQETK